MEVLANGKTYKNAREAAEAFGVKLSTMRNIIYGNHYSPKHDIAAIAASFTTDSQHRNFAVYHERKWKITGSLYAACQYLRISEERGTELIRCGKIAVIPKKSLMVNEKQYDRAVEYEKGVTGKEKRRLRKVLADGVVYDSVAEASRATGVGKGIINRIAKGGRSSTTNIKFEYLEG